VEKICVPVKTAGSIFPARSATAVKVPLKDSRTKNAPISAIGFPLMKNSVQKAQANPGNVKRLKLQKRHSTAFLNKYE